MKKVIIVLIVLSGFKSSFSQGIQFGVKAGTDLNNISGVAFSDKFTFGYHAGLFAQISLSKTISFQPELYYSEITQDTATGFSTVLQFNKPVSQIRLGYFNVPLLLNIKPSKSLAIQAGVKYGIVTSNNFTAVGANVKDAIKNGDLSAVVGAQYYLANFRLYARYQVGLTDINDIGNKDKWTNQAIHIGVGLRLF